MGTAGDVGIGMTIQGCVFRAVALLIIFAMICSVTGAIKIQTERQYPATTSNPGSSPAAVGTAAFHNSTTADVQPPYKTNSWLSPILWADSQTMIYRGIGDINDPNGKRHPLYQLPVYPLPWSLYYCKTTASEQVDNFNTDRLNRVDPHLDGSEVLQGLFVRSMPIYARYDTQLMNPAGSYTKEEQYNMYALYGTYTAPAIHLDPGFNASHIRINRMGDYDAGFVLLSSDDTSLPTAISADAKLSVDTVRGSPFLHLTAEKIPSLNLTIWSGHGAPGITGMIQVGGQNISYVQFTRQMRSYGPQNATSTLGPEISQENQTYIIFYPSESARYNETVLSPITTSQNLIWNRTAVSFSFANQAGPNYLTMTSVPSPDVIDTALLQTLAGAAFQYPTGSTVAYQYDQAKAEVTATYTLSTSDVLKLGTTPMQGLLPIHYGTFFGGKSVLTSTSDWVKNGSGSQLVMNTILGELHFLKGSTFSCTYHYPGVLPYIPGLPDQDNEGKENLLKYLKIWESLYSLGGYSDYKYTGMNLGPGMDTYNGVQILWRAANTYRTAQGEEGARSLSSDAAGSVRKSLSLFFVDKPEVITSVKNGQAPYYSYYDPKAASVLLYPAGTVPNWPPNEEKVLQWDGYGTVTKLNDHHYTYGYFIGAAAQVALDNMTWMELYKDVINQVVFDVAYDPAMQAKAQFPFPKMRYWDPYTGHCSAGGMTYPYYDGNNDESISEELHFWYSVILWGSASKQPDIERLGIVHYTQAVYSYYTFWRDTFGNYQKLWDKVKGPSFDPVWVSKDYAPQIWDSKIKHSTFFGSGPVAVSAITVLPMTGGSFYHAMNSAWIESYIAKYFAYIKKWDMDPLNPQGKKWNQPWDGTNKTGNPWYADSSYYSELACWYALTNPDEAYTKFLSKLDPDTANIQSEFQTKPIDIFSRTEKGVPETYHFIRFLQNYGTPDPLYAHATNTPYSMTFVKNNFRTYIGYNPTDSKMDITFSDGTVIKNVNPRQFGFYPSGLPGPVKAIINATPMGGNPPLEVTFTDRSLGAIIGWEWDFGDGGSSMEQSPVHTYTSTGNFNVTLTVTDINSAKSSDHVTITVTSPGTLPGRFSIINLTNSSGEHPYYPSLAISTNNTVYLSYFSSKDQVSSFKTGSTGSVRSIKMGIDQGLVNIKEDTILDTLTYHKYPIPQPDWGRSSIAIGENETPLVAYLNHGDPYPQMLKLAWKNTESTYTTRDINPTFPWNPSISYNKQEGKPGIGFASGTWKIPVYVYKIAGNWKTDPWDAIAIGQIPEKQIPETPPQNSFVNLLYTSSDPPSRMIFYNSTAKEIRYAYQPNKEAPEKWTIDTVLSNISAGWLSASYDEAHDTLGICWYDTGNKTLMYKQRTVHGPWEPAERVETNQNDVGSYCSLAFGTGVMPGPGISYYNTTAKQLSFAWRTQGKWQNTPIDGSGAGRESSLSFTKEGYPCIAYRHDGMDKLRLAYLHSKTDSEATFTSDITSGPVPLTVQFFDRTVNDTVSSLRALSGEDPEIEVDVHYWWDLNGDGIWDVQDVWNPVFTYAESGTYDVKLLLHVVIYNIYDTRTDIVDFWGVADYDEYITATDPSLVLADFTATPISGTPPLEVTFTDISQGSPSSWYWTFGDRTSSTEQSPVHIYQGIGRYTVSLEINGPAGGGAVRKPAYIDVNGGPFLGPSGMLRVHSEPSGADIFVDGMKQGQTPADTLIVRTGLHNLAVRLDGYQDWTGTVLVDQGEIKFIPTIKLNKK